MGDYMVYRNRGLRTTEAIVNKVEVKRCYPGNHSLAFLLVEGDTDERLYGKFVNEATCQIIIVYGKKTALEVLSLLESDNISGVLAIVDADFDILEKKPLTSGNILFTDTHDLETMMLKSPALDHVVAEFGSREKIVEFVSRSGRDLRSMLLECGRPIGYLRWLSLTEELSLVFEEVDFKKFLDERTLIIDVSKMVKTIKDKSQRHSLVEQDIRNKIAQLQAGTHDHWHVCCGHDLVCILAIGLCKAIGTCNSNEAKPELLERSLRLAFEHSHFRKTQLYASIQKWEGANAPFVILLHVGT